MWLQHCCPRRQDDNVAVQRGVHRSSTEKTPHAGIRDFRVEDHEQLVKPSKKTCHLKQVKLVERANALVCEGLMLQQSCISLGSLANGEDALSPTW